MASRKEQKEQARARRLAEEQALAVAAVRRRRFQQLGGLVVAAIAVIVVVVAVSSGSGSETGLQHNQQAKQSQAAVTKLLTGIHQTGTTLGDPKAPVTMVYFGDLECPICQEFTLSGGLPQLISNDVRAGKVKVIYRSFCTATCNGPGQAVFNTQQVAAYAAGKQSLFWNYAELFYREQGKEDTGYVTASYLNGLAEQIPALKLSTWQKARADTALQSQVSADETSATADDVTGTPTLILEGPKGKEPLSGGVPTYSDLESAIKQVS